MSFSSFQSDLKAVLAPLAVLKGLEIMVELDQDATAEDLAAQDAVFEREISRKGFILVISTPRAEVISTAKLPGAVHLRLLTQIALVENPTINRAALDPEHPEITPAGRKPLVLLRALIAALLAAEYELPAQPITSPEQDLEGLNLHGLLVTAKDHVLADAGLL